MTKELLTPEEFWSQQPPMKNIPDAIREYNELKRAEHARISCHGEQGDERAFLEAARPLMKYLCENHHPHVTAIITGARATLVEGLKSEMCDDYLRD